MQSFVHGRGVLLSAQMRIAPALLFIDLDGPLSLSHAASFFSEFSKRYSEGPLVEPVKLNAAVSRSLEGVLGTWVGPLKSTSFPRFGLSILFRFCSIVPLSWRGWFRLRVCRAQRSPFPLCVVADFTETRDS